MQRVVIHYLHTVHLIAAEAISMFEEVLAAWKR